MTLLFKRLFSRTPKKRLLFFLISDIFLIALSVYLSFLLRLDGKIAPAYIYLPPLKTYIVLMLVLTLPILYLKGLYHFTWAYVSISELIKVVEAVTYSTLTAGVLYFLDRDFHFSFFTFKGLPRSVILINYVLTILFIAGIRAVKRIYSQIFKKKHKQQSKKRLLIVGAGDAGEQILRSILMEQDSPYQPIGFIDDSPLKQKTSIHNIKVLGAINELSKIISQKQIEEVIIALPQADSSLIKRTVDKIKESALLNIKVLPKISEIMNGQISLNDVRTIKVEDLLGRKPAQIDTKLIEESITNKTVLITGAAGSIGSELTKQVLKFKPSKLIILDQDETGIFNLKNLAQENYPYIQVVEKIADIRDKKRINQIFEKHKPEIIFHAAAYKHVSLMEKHPAEAIKNNIYGTWVMADAAVNHNAKKFVLISTDKAVNPTSMMGVSKRLAEMLIMTLSRTGNQFMAVRFGNVLGSRGSVIPIFQEAIENRRPIKITHPEMKRYFMITSEAVLLVMQAGALGNGGEIFILDMGEPVKIIDVAKEMIKLAGLEPDRDIPIIFTKPSDGEKLFEEILTDKENVKTTKYKQIFISRQNENYSSEFLTKLKELVEKVDSLNVSEIKMALKELAPEYKI